MEYTKFTGLDTQVLGISTDPLPTLVAWADDLGGIHKYPLLSDFWPHGAVAQKYGVLREEGYTERAIFVIDREGIIRYVDVHDINDQPSNEVLRAAIREIDPTVRNRPEEPKPAPVPLPHGGIVMYCTPWCPDCKQARRWFADHKIKYTEVNIIETPGADEQVRAWAGGNQTTPTFDIDGAILVDWQLDKIKEILHIRE